jgi:secondary thiamine-phosphate synthase enzyme
MGSMKEILSVPTSERIQLLDITAQVQKRVTEAKFEDGLCILYCPHTTAGLVINENADPDVAADLERAFDAMVPRISFRHSEGNSPAHFLACLTGPSLQLIVEGGRVQLGRWQGIYFCEFDGPRQRQLWLQLLRE